MEFSIISIDDLDQLAYLFMRTFNSEPWNDNWSIESATQRISLQIANPNSIGIKVLDDNEIIGFVSGYITGLTQGKGFYIENLCVSNDYQRQGIGKMLMNSLEMELNKKAINIVITTTAKDFISHKFYSKNGFTDNPMTVGLYKILSPDANQ